MSQSTETSTRVLRSAFTKLTGHRKNCTVRIWVCFLNSSLTTKYSTLTSRTMNSTCSSVTVVCWWATFQDWRVVTRLTIFRALLYFRSSNSADMALFWLHYPMNCQEENREFALQRHRCQTWAESCTWVTGGSKSSLFFIKRCFRLSHAKRFLQRWSQSETFHFKLCLRSRTCSPRSKIWIWWNTIEGSTTFRIVPH